MPGASQASHLARRGFPALYGVKGLTDANYLQAVASAMSGFTAGFWATFAFIDFANAVANRILFGFSYGSTGFDLRIISNSFVTFTLFDAGSVYRASPLASIGSADFGNIYICTGVFDQPNSKVRLYARRAEVGTGTTCASYALNNTQPKNFGRAGPADPGQPASDVALLGMAYGSGVPTLAQCQAHYDLIKANQGRMKPMAGLTTVNWYDFTSDVMNNGNALPTTYADRAGSGATLSKVGTPTLHAQISQQICF